MWAQRRLAHLTVWLNDFYPQDWQGKLNQMIQHSNRPAINTSSSDFIRKVGWPKLRYCWLCTMKKCRSSVCHSLNPERMKRSLLQTHWIQEDCGCCPGPCAHYNIPNYNTSGSLQCSNILTVPWYIHISSLHVPDGKLSIQSHPVKKRLSVHSSDLWEGFINVNLKFFQFTNEH